MRTEGSDKPIECTSKTKRPKLENERIANNKSFIRWFNIPLSFSTQLWTLQNICTHYKLIYRMRCT